MNFLATVNSEIFTRVLFSRNFAYVKFHENIILTNWRITLPFTDIGKLWPCREFLTSQICVLNAIPENKVHAKISEFTVLVLKVSHKCVSI